MPQWQHCWTPSRSTALCSSALGALVRSRRSSSRRLSLAYQRDSWSGQGVEYSSAALKHMAFEVEEDDAHLRGRSNATVTDEQGDCHRKGKRVTRRASSDVAGMSTMPENTVEVVTQNGRIRRQNNDIKLYVEQEVRESNKGLGTLSKARIPLDEEGQIHMALKESLREYDEERIIGCSSGSRSASCSANQQTRLDRFYRSPSVSQGPFDIDLAHSRAQAQPQVDIMLRGGSREKLGKALAKWFHTNDISGRKANCPYFRLAIKLAQECGQGVHIPIGKEFDGKYLDMNYEDMDAHKAKFKDNRKEYGVVVMCDSWTGKT
ncbi:hypothetical protein ZEAMMB73_Zm00001d024167 [Zea mays]|uniref:DUF659 domain-containing protein n=2 Tax=Zea mays TaxID=4577 RepID=A0A1D6IXU3_MAIZE|nr:hypothetical protein ZEAMMB73_Zm00001d024167 [Zea mays]